MKLSKDIHLCSIPSLCTCALYLHAGMLRPSSTPRSAWGWPHSGPQVPVCGSCSSQTCSCRTCSGTASCCLRNLTLPPRTWGSRPLRGEKHWLKTGNLASGDNLYISCSLGKVCWYSSLTLQSPQEVGINILFFFFFYRWGLSFDLPVVP